MSHLHEMRDTDSHFIVDPVTRTIKNTSIKSTLIQYDHKSEILTFEIPRYVDDHDMSLCNRVEIHYVNSNSSTRQQNLGVYEVEDFHVSEDDENVVIWSWPIPNHATQFVGPLAFAFRFACLTEDVVDYAWSTAPFNGIAVSAGIYNSEHFVEEYIDILQQWENKIGTSIEDVKQTTSSSDPNGVNIITLVLSNGKKQSFVVRNGITPIRGVDYWTEEDKAEIIAAILDIIPVAEEASF